ncbi:cyclic nucleotide-binding domain-containing protein [Paraglaciecola arctica]|uniref:cyclic nucleotide-binding domain-containing protein n=1 Tax=Paraglaciecola arctica TaxID=1128911 RepID=UPI001C07E788|nr:cyclic nucleotide-binding and patatin-like phospholipase domain-containing protein [Paraglaciecola arctica]MBU3004937.1 cyclic nucleotide-binding domain-containing protein [Paraglaciecola arctica]
MDTFSPQENADLDYGSAQTITLNEKERQIFTEYAQIRTVSADDYLVTEGDGDTCFYLLITGNLVKEQSGKAKMLGMYEQLEEGELIGLLSFFTEEKHLNSILARADSQVAIITREIYDSLLAEQPLLWEKLQSIGLHMMRKHRLSIHLDKLFGPFGVMLPFVLADIEHELEWVTLPSGQTLFRQGDVPDGAYILVAGRLQMTTKLLDGREVVNDAILAGETIGETALLTAQPQAHTVYAVRDSELVKLSNYSFELMLQRNTRAIHNIAHILGKRLTDLPIEKGTSKAPVRCISLLPANADLELSNFAQQLCSTLSDYGSTKHLSSDIVNAELATEGIAQSHENEATSLRLVEWLHSQEDDCQYLVYQSDQKWSQWSARCVRQTDQVIVVAEANSEPDLSALAPHLSGERQRWSLVLLHELDTDRPRNTAAWLNPVSPDAIYHVRKGHTADMARVTRILSGNAVSLVLGGGGARGFAHLGVIKAMEELNIPIDMVGGTSMGAPIAGIVAQGANADQVMQRAKQAYYKIIDFTFPLVSVIAGKRISQTIREQTQGWDIEDYWLPFFCVSTNLTTALPVIHQRGDSWIAIRSSVSIPGVLPPVPHGDELLVDGGVLNNLPVDIMREINPFGVVIAVDVAPPVGPKAKSDYGTELSGWQLLIQRLFPWLKAPSVPSLGSTIMQAMVAGSALKRQQIIQQQQADLYLNIHVKGVGMLQFDAQSKATKIGYKASFARLKAHFNSTDKKSEIKQGE